VFRKENSHIYVIDSVTSRISWISKLHTTT